MPDSALSAYVDASGQPWFACVLGNARQVFGLCLYRGAAGLRFHRQVEELGEKLDPADFRYEQDAVSVWYGPKAQLDPEQRKLYQKLGFAPQGGDRLSWPDIRSHRPGFFPWYPEESELRVLVDVIPGILCLAEIYRSHPDCYDRRDGLELPAVPAAGAPVKLDSLQWRTWLTPPPPEIGPAVQVDLASPAFRRAAALPRQDETLEVDWFYMPEAVMEEGRPFYGRCLAVFREHGGYCFGMDLLKPGDDAAIRAATMILEAVERLGARPARITATKPELAERLRPLAASLGAESKTVHRLLSVGEFRAGLEARMAEGMP